MRLNIHIRRRSKSARKHTHTQTHTITRTQTHNGNKLCQYILGRTLVRTHTHPHTHTHTHLSLFIAYTSHTYTRTNTHPYAPSVAGTMKMFKKVFGGGKTKEEKLNDAEGGAVAARSGAAAPGARQPPKDLPDRHQPEIQAILREQAQQIQQQTQPDGEKRVQCPDTGKWYTESEIIVMEAIKAAERDKHTATAKRAGNDSQK